jgi:hypothetical protein
VAALVGDLAAPMPAHHHDQKGADQ